MHDAMCATYVPYICSAVNNPPLAESTGLDLASIAPTLEAFETEAFTFLTT